MYNYETTPALLKILGKLSRKDKQLYENILGKIDEIINCEDVEHYKNLKFNMKDKKRVHVGHFVLVFKFVKEENKIIFLDFGHHDDMYK